MTRNESALASEKISGNEEMSAGDSAAFKAIPAATVEQWGPRADSPVAELGRQVNTTRQSPILRRKGMIVSNDDSADGATRKDGESPRKRSAGTSKALDEYIRVLRKLPIHESAHAVMRWLFGDYIKYISLRPDRTSMARVITIDIPKNEVADMAILDRELGRMLGAEYHGVPCWRVCDGVRGRQGSCLVRQHGQGPPQRGPRRIDRLHNGPPGR